MRNTIVSNNAVMLGILVQNTNHSDHGVRWLHGEGSWKTPLINISFANERTKPSCAGVMICL